MTNPNNPNRRRIQCLLDCGRCQEKNTMALATTLVGGFLRKSSEPEIWRISCPYEKPGPTGLLWHASRMNGAVAGARSSSPIITEGIAIHVMQVKLSINYFNVRRFSFVKKKTVPFPNPNLVICRTTYLSTQFNHEEDYTYQKNNGSGGNRKEKLEKEQTNMRNHMAGYRFDILHKNQSVPNSSSLKEVCTILGRSRWDRGRTSLTFWVEHAGKLSTRTTQI